MYAASQNRLAQGDKDDNRIPKGGTPGFGIFLNFHVSTLNLRLGVQLRTGCNQYF
jgi:hemoglobin/transferrin/lactoferrin receptor protein